MQEIGRSDPGLMQLINSNQQEFMRMLSEPVPPGTDPSAALAAAAGGAAGGGGKLKSLISSLIVLSSTLAFLPALAQPCRACPSTCLSPVARIAIWSKHSIMGNLRFDSLDKDSHKHKSSWRKFRVVHIGRCLQVDILWKFS